MWPADLGQIVAKASRSQFDPVYGDVRHVMCVESSAAFLRATELLGISAVQNTEVINAILDQGSEATRKGIYSCEVLQNENKKYRMIDCQELPQIWRSTKSEPEMILVHSMTYGNVPYDSTPVNDEDNKIILNGKQLGEKAARVARRGLGAVLIIGNFGLAVFFSGDKNEPIFIFDPHGWMGGPAYVTKLSKPADITAFIKAYVNNSSGVYVTMNFVYWLFTGGWNFFEQNEKMSELITAAVIAKYGSSDIFSADNNISVTLDTQLPVAISAKRASLFAQKSLMALSELRKKNITSNSPIVTVNTRGQKRSTPRPKDPSLLDSTEKLSNIAPVKVKKSNDITQIEQHAKCLPETRLKADETLCALAQRPVWRLKLNSVASHESPSELQPSHRPSRTLLELLKILPETPNALVQTSARNLWTGILGARIERLTDRMLVFLVENGITVRKAESEVGFLIDPLLAVLSHRNNRELVASLIAHTRLNLSLLVERKPDLLRLTELRGDDISAVLVHKTQEVCSKIITETNKLTERLKDFTNEITSKQPNDAYEELEKELLNFSKSSPVLAELPNATSPSILTIVGQATTAVHDIEKAAKDKADRELRTKRADEKLLILAERVWSEINHVAEDATRGAKQTPSAILSRDKIKIPDPSLMPSAKDYSELPELNRNASDARQKITDAASRMLKMYGNVIDYSISAFTTGTQGALGRFALASQALERIKTWIDRLYYLNDLITGLATLSGRPPINEWSQFTTIDQVRVLEGLLETSSDLSSDENLNHWAFQLSEAYSSGFLPSPAKWLTAVTGINTRVKEMELSMGALLELETEIKTTESMDAGVDVRLECARHALDSAKAILTTKIGSEQKTRAAAVQAKAAKIIEDCQSEINETKRREEETAKKASEIRKILMGFFRPIEKFQGLKNLDRNIIISGLTDNDISSIVGDDDQLSRTLTADIITLINNYEKDFSELETSNLLDVTGPLLRGISFLKVATKQIPSDLGFITFLTEIDNELLYNIASVKGKPDTATCANILTRLDSIKNKLEALNKPWPEFAAMAEKKVKEIKNRACAADRTTRNKELIDGMLKRLTLAINTFNKNDGDLNDSVASALDLVETIKHEIFELKLSDEEKTSSDYVSLEKSLSELSDIAKRKLNDYNERAWRNRLLHLLESDRDKGEFSRDSWEQALDEGNGIGGRQAVTEDLVKLSRSVLDYWAQHGIRLLRTFFSNNPYLKKESYVSDVLEVVRSLRCSKWVLNFPTVVDIYEDLFGTPTAKLTALCKISEDVVEAFDAVDSPENIDMHTLIQNMASNLFRIPELEEFFNFYIDGYEMYLDTLTTITDKTLKINFYEHKSKEAIKTAEKTALLERCPLVAKERLERGEEEVKELVELRDLRNALKFETKKQFEKTAFLEPLEHGYAETRKNIDRIILELETEQKNSHARIKAHLSALWQEKETETRELAKNLKTLKDVLVTRSPKDIAAAINGAESLNDIVKIFSEQLLLAEEENKHGIIKSETLDWLTFAKTAINRSDIASRTDGEGPLCQFVERLHKLIAEGTMLDALFQTLADYHNVFVKDLANFKEVSGKQKDETEDGWWKYSEAASKVAKSSCDLRTRLNDRVVDKLRNETIVKTYEKSLDDAEPIIKDAELTLEATTTGMRKLVTLYETAKKELVRKHLENLEKEIVTIANGYGIPKWFRVLHADIEKLIELRLGLYQAYESLKISAVPQTTIPPESMVILPGTVLAAARVTAFMARAEKPIMTVTTHSLGTIGSVIVDESERSLEYALCYATVSEKAAALWAAANKFGHGNFDGLKLCAPKNEAAVDNFSEKTHAVISLSATAIWLSAVEPLITSEINSYFMFCSTERWPAVARENKCPTISVCACYCALLYSALARTYGSASDVSIDQNGDFFTHHNEDVGTGEKLTRKFTFTATDLLILLAACEPAHLVYFSRLDLLRQSEYMHKTLEPVLSRAIREKVGLSSLVPGSSSGSRKTLPFDLSDLRSKFDNSRGSCFAIDKRDWDTVKTPKYVSNLLDPWKTLPDIRGSVEKIEKIIGGSVHGLTPTLMMLSLTCIPSNILEALWIFLGPQDNADEELLPRDSINPNKIGEAGSIDAMMNFMIRRSATVENYTVTTGGCDTRIVDSLNAKLLGPAIGSMVYSLTSDQTDLKKLCAFDVALLAIIFGAKVIICTEISALSSESGLVLYSSIFDSRDGIRYTEFLGNASEKTITTANLKNIILADPNRIENACLFSQADELNTLLLGSPLRSSTPLLFVSNHSNQITQILIQSKSQPSRFVVTLKPDPLYDEVPVRYSSKEFFPEAIREEDVRNGDLFFSAIIGGEMPIFDNPEDMCTTMPEYSRDEKNIFPFAKVKPKKTSPVIPNDKDKTFFKTNSVCDKEEAHRTPSCPVVTPQTLSQTQEKKDKADPQTDSHDPPQENKDVRRNSNKPNVFPAAWEKNWKSPEKSIRKGSYSKKRHNRLRRHFSESSDDEKIVNDRSRHRRHRSSKSHASDEITSKLQQNSKDLHYKNNETVFTKKHDSSENRHPIGIDTSSGNTSFKELVYPTACENNENLTLKNKSVRSIPDTKDVCTQQTKPDYLSHSEDTDVGQWDEKYDIGLSPNETDNEISSGNLDPHPRTSDEILLSSEALTNIVDWVISNTDVSICGETDWQDNSEEEKTSSESNCEVLAKAEKNISNALDNEAGGLCFDKEWSGSRSTIINTDDIPKPWEIAPPSSSDDGEEHGSDPSSDYSRYGSPVLCQPKEYEEKRKSVSSPDSRSNDHSCIFLPVRNNIESNSTNCFYASDNQSHDEQEPLASELNGDISRFIAREDTLSPSSEEVYNSNEELNNFDYSLILSRNNETDSANNILVSHYDEASDNSDSHSKHSPINISPLTVKTDRTNNADTCTQTQVVKKSNIKFIRQDSSESSGGETYAPFEVSIKFAEEEISSQDDGRDIVSDEETQLANDEEPTLKTLNERTTRLKADAKSITAYVRDIDEALKDSGEAVTEFFVRSEQSCVESDEDRRESTISLAQTDTDKYGTRDVLTPLDPTTRGKIYASLAVTCRLILRGVRQARDRAEVNSENVLVEANKIKLLLN